MVSAPVAGAVEPLKEFGGRGCWGDQGSLNRTDHQCPIIANCGGGHYP